MKLACIVLAHRGPEQVGLLLSALKHPQVRVFLHLDRRSRLAPFTRAVADVGVDGTVLLPRRAARWGGIELVDAAIDGLARGRADGCNYFMLISGQDFPLRPVKEILAFAEEAADRSYVRHFPLPTERWRFGGRDRTDFYTYDLLGRRETCIPRGEDVSNLSRRGKALNAFLRALGAPRPPRRFPTYARAYGGSQWWNLSRAAADHVLRFLDNHPEYRRYHAHTLAPDELFFHSILLGTPFREEQEVVNDSLRFMIWPQGSSHPRTLLSADLPEILASRKPFARKFDLDVDGSVLQQLPVAQSQVDR